MQFPEFIAPMSVETFLAEYYGQRPLHIKAEAGTSATRGDLLSLDRLGELMGVLPHWTEDNLKLIINSRRVSGEHYLAEERPGDRSARRADPVKVHALLRTGASLVANALEEVDSKVRQVTAMLADQFAASAGANAYCSFKDVQAFNSHCDLHEVFAVQLEGQKAWRIYENRADAPVKLLEGADAQQMIDRTKGKVMMTVPMEPGDLLYIPRGYFHDALASSEASLHLTLAVAPLHGRYVLRLIEELAMRDPEFRAYLPDGRVDDGASLRAQLDRLAGKIADLVRSPLFAGELTARQRALARPDFDFDFRDRPKANYFARTGNSAEIDWKLTGPVLRHGNAEEPLGPLASAAEWALEQPAFSEPQLHARFAWLSDSEVDELVTLLTRQGLFAPYDPAR